ncbi:MAG: HAD family phosphatase [Bdellovibrionales bacterium]|nr:HAD family phosphatase [Bdellovibrionales bacterium]
MPKVKYIFWDNDGVLVDTEPLFYQATKSIFADLGFDLTDELFQQWFLSDSRGAWHLLGGERSSSSAVKEYKRKRDVLYSQLLSQTDHRTSHVQSTLNRLYGSIPMGVVTSSKPEHFHLIHDSTGYKRFFEFILTREAYALSKPEPDPYIKALELSGVSPQEAVVVEDSERGLRSAIAAGIKCWVLPSELTTGSDFSGADRILTSIEEVLTLLED